MNFVFIAKQLRREGIEIIEFANSSKINELVYRKAGDIFSSGDMKIS